MTPKYPDVHVELSGQDGNAFMIIGSVSKALRRAGASRDDVDEFHRQATAGDYNHLLQVCDRWVVVT